MREWHCKNCNTIFPGPPVASYVDYDYQMKRQITPPEIIHCVRLAIKEKERLENAMMEWTDTEMYKNAVAEHNRLRKAEALLREAREMIAYPNTPTAPIRLIARIDKFLKD